MLAFKQTLPCVVLAVSLCFASSVSVVDNDFETDLGVWQSTNGNDTATWLVQTFDEHWTIPRPADGTSYATIYRPECSDSPAWNELRSPNLILQPGDAISFKYYLWGHDTNDPMLYVNVSDKTIATLHALADNVWHAIIVPLDIQSETNKTIIFTSFTGSGTSKVAIDEVRLISLGPVTKGYMLDKKRLMPEEPASKDLKNSSGVIIDNDFELDLGVWKNIPLGYSAGWLVEEFNPVLDIARPAEGTGYARALRYDCFEDMVRLRMETPELTVKIGDILAFDVYINCLESASILKVALVSDSVEFPLAELSSTNQGKWEPLYIPVQQVISDTSKFAFELESTTDYDYVAIDNVRLITE